MGKINRISYKELMNYTAQSKIPAELFEDILTWPDLIKSPCSLSFYSAPVDWNYKPDNSYRVSDHWNFYTRHDKNLHCATDIEVPKDYWALGQFDLKLKTYKILKVFKPSDQKLNRSKKFQLLSLDIAYKKAIEGQAKFKDRIDFSFLKKYYKILENTQ